MRNLESIVSIFIILCLGAWTNGENSIRLLPLHEAALSTGTSSRAADARVRRYRASMRLDENMFDMTNIILGLEDEMMFIKSKSYKRTNEIDGQTIVWSGLSNSTSSSDDATASFLTLSQSPSGGISASVKTARTSYSILTLSNGNMLVTATDRSEFQYEPSTAVDGNTKNQAKIPDGFPAIEIAKSYKVRSRYDDDTQVSFGPASRLLVSTTTENDRQRNLQTIAVADVLVLVTNEAMCLSVNLEPGCPLTDANSVPIIDYLQTVAEAEVNDGMQSVGARAGIRIVQISILLPNLNLLKPDLSSLIVVDGSCQVRDLRVETNADLVAVITGDNVVDNNGRINLGIAEIDGFASVIGLLGLLNTFTFTHEIGHSYGCLHDRTTCEENDSPLHPYAHGFQLIPFHYTVMAYQCENDACPLNLPIFSTPDFTFQGRSIGDEEHNNVRQLNNAAAAVSRRSLNATCSSAPTRAPTNSNPTTCDPSNPFCSISDIILQLINLIALIFGQ